MTFRWNKHPLLSLFSSHIIAYPTPINLNYMWSFGSAAGICLVIQIITGIFLAMYYTLHIDYAFLSIEFIMRNVNNGWIIRYLQANGASIFFIVVYCHILRGLYFGSYIQSRGPLWMSGVLLLILMMANAFIGYVLPLGLMSFWGVTVITNFFSAIPYVRKSIVEWLWGGFSIGNPSLNRFFSYIYKLITYISSILSFFENKKNKKDFLIFRDKKLYFMDIEIPGIISVSNCRNISFNITNFGFTQFYEALDSQYGYMDCEIIKNFIKTLEKKGVLGDFLIFFSTKDELNFKFLPESASTDVMIKLSALLWFEIIQNNGVITNDFYNNLHNILMCSFEDVSAIILYLKTIKKPYNLIEFWLN